MDERAGPVALRRMNDESRLLREHDHVLVLETDVERYVLGNEIAAVVGRHLDLDALPCPNRELLGLGPTVDEHEPLVDEARCGRTAREEVERAENGVQPHALLVVGDDVLEVLRRAHRGASCSRVGHRSGVLGRRLLGDKLGIGHEQQPQDQYRDPHDDRRVSHVEHREVDERELEHVGDTPDERPVDEVADGPAGDQTERYHQRPRGGAGPAPVQRDHDQHHDGRGDEDGLEAGKQPEGRSGVAHEGEVEHDPRRTDGSRPRPFAHARPPWNPDRPQRWQG